jgi:hypothetical protein
LRLFRVPEGLSVRADGTWHVGEYPVAHEASLRYFKAHLVFEQEGSFIVDGTDRQPVAIEGPAFEVIHIDVDHGKAEIRLALDDGSEELVTDGALGMDPVTGRLECRVRGGLARAAFSRGAHQALLDLAEEEGGLFFVRVAGRRLSIST